MKMAVLFAILGLSVLFGQLGIDSLSLIFFVLFVCAGFFDAVIDSVSGLLHSRNKTHTTEV